MGDSAFQPGTNKDGSTCKACTKLGRHCYRHVPGAQSKPYKFDALKRRGYLDALEKNGLTRGAAASAVGVTRQAVAEYRRRNEEFAILESLAEMTALGTAEDRLFKAGTIADDWGHVNVVALLFWLKNRAPDKWKDMRTFEVVDKLRDLERPLLFRALDAAGLTDEQLEMVERILNGGTISDAATGSVH